MTTYDNPGVIGDVPPDPNKVESTWGNAVRDRLVNNFADDDERDDFYSGAGGAVVGQVSHSHDRPGELEVFSGATVEWTPPWNTSWGLLEDGVAVASGADQDESGGTADIDGCSVTFVALAGRRYRYEGVMQVTSNADSDLGVLQIANSADDVLGRDATPINTSGEVVTCNAHAVDTPGAGNKTRKLRIANPNVNTVTVRNGVFPARIDVYDVGPHGDPPS